MKYSVLLIMTLLLISAFIAGCTGIKSTSPAPVPTATIISSPSGSAPGAGAGSALTGSWNFQAGVYGGRNAFIVPTDVQITAVFDDQGNLSGFAGCNNYNARYTLTGQQLTMGQEIVIGPIAATQKSCADSTVETPYLNVLQNANAYVVHGNNLVLTDTKGDQLVFQR